MVMQPVCGLRGIDLILEGMNVNVFSDGEDPIVLKKNIYEDLVLYLENGKHHQFKASLLMNEAKNDPSRFDSRYGS
jgi:hypothetical protein